MRPVGSDLGLTPPKSQIPHLAIRFPTEPGEHWRQRFDVRQRGAEVDDARAEREPAADNRVRQKRLAAALDAREQFLIQPLQVRLDLRRRLCWPEVVRNVPERRDAEMLGDRFEILVPLDEPMEMPREADIVANHLEVPVFPTRRSASQTFNARNPREFCGP